MKANSDSSIIQERDCPVCGKRFICTILHAYKDKRSPYKKVCSWSCVCESERLKEAAMKRKTRKRVK